jgi:hypothetical protein
MFTADVWLPSDWALVGTTLLLLVIYISVAMYIKRQRRTIFRQELRSMDLKTKLVNNEESSDIQSVLGSLAEINAKLSELSERLDAMGAPKPTRKSTTWSNIEE